MAEFKRIFSLAAGYESIRTCIARQVTPFGRCTPREKEKRRRRALAHLRFFAETYFPHYLTHPPSKMHQALYTTCQRLILDAEATGRGGRHAEAAPRGHAKSTLTSLILPLWCIVGQRRKFMGLVSDTTHQAEEFLEFLKAELEVNERLQEDFPEACGRGRPWRLGQIITRNGVRLKCWGKRKAIRGARHRNRRLDLILCDDMEGDQAVASPRQREKDRAWFFKALMKAGGRYTVVIVVGTVLHHDSLLARVLKRPGWSGRKWQAVLRWSSSPLWDRWETLYAAGDEAAADRLYRVHETKMLCGARVLWPEVEDYLFLMKMRVSDGPAFFDSEKQNDPLPPGEALFNEDWFVFIAEAEVERHLAESRYHSILAAVDPSMGKTARQNDPSAIVIAGRREDGVLDILEADIEHRHPDRLMEDLFAWHKKYGFTLAGIEEVQFQELFKDLVVKESARRGMYLPVEGLRPHTDKHLRIMRLQPHIKNGVFRFRRRQTRLLDQLRFYPRADHDDGPDALEMLLTLTQRSLGGPRIRSLVQPKSIA